MTNRLFAFFNDAQGERAVGVFERVSAHNIIFTYHEHDTSDTPLFLSLPRCETPADGAAKSYLENLLPDSQLVRDRWARTAGVDSHDPREAPRMSLAGQQGKFSIAHIRDRWYWPTYEQPSTHIIKPASAIHELLDENETGALHMAQALGVATKNKYNITAVQIALKLRKHGADAGAFVQQLAFNT